MKYNIPYGRQFIDEDDINAVVEVLRSELITTGPMAEKFEKALAEKVGANYVVVFSSGTAALHAAYFVAGLNPGEEVITSPITFAATANAALYLGGKPVFVDIAADSFNIDIEKIESAISNNTKIIAPVDMAGFPVDIDQVMEIANHHNLVVVEDAAHALGATYKGRPVGSTAHMSVFSFHPVKHITTGEGGAVATNSIEYYEKLIMFRSHGITAEPLKFIKNTIKPWHQEMHFLGYNYRLTDIQCALGLSQLNKLDRFIIRRKQVADKYNQALSKLNNIQVPPIVKYGKPAWHIYIIRLEDGFDKSNMVYALSDCGVVTRVHYIPVYRHPYYENMKISSYSPVNYPNAEKYYKQALTIPLYPAMTDEQVEYVIESIEKIFC